MYFGPDSSTVDRRAAAELRRVLALLESTPPWTRLRLSGHADNRFPPAVALRLSRARALAIKAWLASHGAAEDRIDVEFFGQARPLGKNTSEAGRSVNRRVDYAFLTIDD